MGLENRGAAGQTGPAAAGTDPDHGRYGFQTARDADFVFARFVD